MSGRRPWLLLLLLLMLMSSDTVSCLPAGTTDATALFTLTSPVNHLTCYFCENVENNHVCNRFAIDHPCPAGTSFCRTLHIMDNTGHSLVVNKHCASELQCGAAKVGCLQEDHQKTCVSCCHSSYCNEPVPTNYSNAVRDVKPTAPTRAVTSRSGPAVVRPTLPPLVTAALVTVVTVVAVVRPEAGLAGWLVL